VATLGQQHRAHAACTLTACLDPLHPGPCKGWKGHPEEAFHRATRQAKSGIRAYNTARTVKGGKATHRRALLSYVNGSGPINRSLRFSKGHGSNDPKIVAEIKAMDTAMAQSKLPAPIVVQRAVSPSAFGGIDTSDDLTGVEYTDHAFGSTGTDLGLILKHFHTTSSGRKPLIADITVPKGFGAIRVPPGQWGDEKEILLDRGAHFRVVKDHGFIDTPAGKFRHVQLEVVPGSKPKAGQVDLGEKNQKHRNTAENIAAGPKMEHGGVINDGPPPKSQAASVMVIDDECLTGEFCMQTHKPGLCKGQKRGQSEPGVQEETKKNPAAVARTAVEGLTNAIGKAEQIATANAVRNPKLAALARKAAADYQKALRPHQQTLKDAANTDDRAKRQGEQDTRQQDALDKRDAKKRDSLKKRAQAIVDRRKRQADETAKLKKMTTKQAAAYRKARAEKARKQREARENKLIKQANAA
jgi:hypothetical protein